MGAKLIANKAVQRRIEMKDLKFGELAEIIDSCSVNKGKIVTRCRKSDCSGFIVIGSTDPEYLFGQHGYLRARILLPGELIEVTE